MNSLKLRLLIFIVLCLSLLSGCQGKIKSAEKIISQANKQMTEWKTYQMARYTYIFDVAKSKYDNEIREVIQVQKESEILANMEKEYRHRLLYETENQPEQREYVKVYGEQRNEEFISYVEEVNNQWTKRMVPMSVYRDFNQLPPIEIPGDVINTDNNK